MTNKINTNPKANDTTKVDTTNYEITFRTKFEKVLPEDMRATVLTAFKSFCAMSEDAAIDFLWKLTYTAGSDEFDEVLEELGIDQIFAPEKAKLVRNEFRYQYERNHPNCSLSMNLIKPCTKDPYMEIMVKTDPVVAITVYNHCINCLYMANKVERAIYLLGSENENYFYGGIRELGFTPEEAAYLKEYHLILRDMLKALYEEKEGTKQGNRPLEGLGEMLEKAGIELPAEAPVMSEAANETEKDINPVTEATSEAANETAKDINPVSEVISEPVNETAKDINPVSEVTSEPANETAKDINPVSNVTVVEKGFAPLTPELVIAHQELFQSFVCADLNALLEIGKLGVDLNEVMAKLEKIKDLLAAVKALSE